MIEMRQTDHFAKWLSSLRDLRGRARVLARIERLSMGHLGDVQPVGEGVSELRIHFGPGYRVYFKQIGERIVILLAGGDKTTQKRDVRKALELARQLSEDPT